MSTSVSRFIVRNIDCYDSTSDESDDEFDLAEFSCEYSLSSHSVPKVSDFPNLHHASAPQTGAIHVQQTDSNTYKIKVPPIIIPSSYIKFTKYSPSTSAPSSYESSTESTESTDSSASVTPSDLSRTSSSSMSPSMIAANSIHFDSDCGSCLLSTNGFDSGFHEWSIKVMNVDESHQEIGIISKVIDDPQTDSKLIRDNSMFGARAVYGHIDGNAYYASYNDDNSCRCYKSLAVKQWQHEDEIKICLDLDKGSITFYLNDERVRKSISVQRNTIYYPFISNTLHSEYAVADYTDIE